MPYDLLQYQCLAHNYAPAPTYRIPHLQGLVSELLYAVPSHEGPDNVSSWLWGPLTDYEGLCCVGASWTRVVCNIFLGIKSVSLGPGW